MHFGWWGLTSNNGFVSKLPHFHFCPNGLLSFYWIHIGHYWTLYISWSSLRLLLASMLFLEEGVYFKPLLASVLLSLKFWPLLASTERVFPQTLFWGNISIPGMPKCHFYQAEHFWMLVWTNLFGSTDFGRTYCSFKWVSRIFFNYIEIRGEVGERKK